MRKVWVAVLLAALALAALPAQAPANHTMRHRVAKLERQVNALQAKMNCFRRAGASLYRGFAAYDEDTGDLLLHVDDPSDTNFAAIFDQIFNVRTSDYWLSTVNKTRSCTGKFAVVRSPYAGRVATRAVALAKLHRLSRFQ
jgi:hypothetical protein